MKAIIITSSNPMQRKWGIQTPKFVFNGTLKQAKAHCEELNKNALSNHYAVLSVNVIEPKQ